MSSKTTYTCDGCGASIEDSRIMTSYGMDAGSQHWCGACWEAMLVRSPAAASAWKNVEAERDKLREHARVLDEKLTDVSAVLQRSSEDARRAGEERDHLGEVVRRLLPMIRRRHRREHAEWLADVAAIVCERLS